MRLTLPFLLGALAATAASAEPPTPRVLSDADRASYAQAFAALRGGDWATASTTFDRMPGGTLSAVGQAELCVAKGAPTPDAARMAALLATAPDLPEAPALAALARRQGAAALPALPAQHELFRVGGASKRQSARANRGDAAAQTLAVQVTPLVKAGDIAGAEALVEAAAATLMPEALTEWRQKIAWAYFQNGDDGATRRVAERARTGPGEWAVQAAWVAGLSAWRAGDYPAAAAAFGAVAANGGDAETIAAGQYWTARSDMAGGHPERVGNRLRIAARMGETFYGLLAGAALGVAPPPAAAMSADPGSLLRHPNLRAAAALVEIGEKDLADRMIRQQARIGAASEHLPLMAFAGRLGLPATQLWLAQNAPAGIVSSPAQRYPMPAWAPSGGWRVDRALLFAHALQESQFRTDAVSRAGARGLMQLMPATARLVARHRGDPVDMAERMNDPALNFEYGQSYLEELAGHYGTGGLLPKVIAAYNAGPNNVALWDRPVTQRDPLLFIESIPFAETRAYVAIVLRNYWMYQRESGAATASLIDLASGKWPLFPRRSGIAPAPATTIAGMGGGTAGIAGGAAD